MSDLKQYSQRPASCRILRAMLMCVALLTLLAGPPPVIAPASAAPNPLSCEGYPEKRVFLESQSWWSDSREPFPGAHIHLGTCFPLLQEISGIVHFDIRGVLHNDPGLVTRLRIQAWDDPNGDPIYSEDLSWSCSPDQTCTRWFSVDVDTTQLAEDGRKEFRMTLDVPSTPEGPNVGNRQFQTTRWQAVLANGGGRPIRDYETPDRTGAAAWYTDSGYTNVRIRGIHALQAADGSVCGTWSPEVRGEKDRFVVSVDAANHGQDPGVIVYDGLADNVWRTLDIDTTILGDGQHRLFLRADDVQPNGTSSGIFVIPFNVAPSSALVETNCSDGLDDDCDGLNDCRDSDCTLAPSCLCDDDGVCEFGEDCEGCPNDCPGGTCGNGTCDVANGEDCVSCPADCNGEQGGRKSERYCCGAGGGFGPVPCSDERCSAGNFICSDVPAASFCCGNESCEEGEDRLLCSIDCGGPPVCGDTVCEAGESPCSCAPDCGAPPTSETMFCSNGIDDDCDNLTDCNDTDCTDKCTSSCVTSKGACSNNGDCCSDNCKNGTCRGG